MPKLFNPSSSYVVSLVQTGLLAVILYKIVLVVGRFIEIKKKGYWCKKYSIVFINCVSLVLTGTSVRLSFRPSKIFFSVTVDGRDLIFGHISWEAFLDPSDSYFLFADFVDLYTHWTSILIFRRIFLSNYWWQKSDIRSQASYRYPISWKAFFDPSDSYFLFAEERGYHRWALAHSSSCYNIHVLRIMQYFSLGRTWWRLFQKHVVSTNQYLLKGCVNVKV